LLVLPIWPNPLVTPLPSADTALPVLVITPLKPCVVGVLPPSSD
jgi:hypothetical protein